MSTSGVASQVSCRCSMAVLAASPASFHPSNAATMTGSTSGSCSGVASSSAGLGRSGTVTGQAYGPGLVAGDRRLVAMPDTPASPLLSALSNGVVVADGAMGTALQSVDLTLDDFDGFEGCNEILNLTRPDVVRDVHRGYFEAGSDAVETNTFGANLANLAEYDIAEKIFELSEAGARLAREVADEFSTPDRPRWVLGSVGPGTKLPALGHTSFAALRDAYREEVRGLLVGGADAVIAETTQDILQAKSAIIGAKHAMAL